MSTRILKFAVPLDSAVNYQAAKPFRPVHVGFQGDETYTVYVWAECDDERPTMIRTFRVLGTGEWVEPDLAYVGTAQESGKGLVWHVFEVTPSG